jgi:alpha-aminoadipic semialdehyde synthase
MAGSIAVRRETKSPWEKRSPVTPDLARKLVTQSNLEILVQPSARRVFPDKEYVRAGATMSENLSDAAVVVGVKEIPPELLQPGTAYVFFSHVIKGQPYNMPMLQQMLDLGCTLIDYEKICDESGRRLIFFGRFAGLAGMIDTLWALGRRLKTEGFTTPLAEIEPAHAYDSLHEAKRAIRIAGEQIASDGLPAELLPMTFGIAGYGNVASGVREILAELPTRDIAPADLESTLTDPSPRCIYQTTFREEHLVEPRTAGGAFDLQDYYDHPDGYTPSFEQYLPYLTVLMNCTYWDERYPRLVTKEQLRTLFATGSEPRLKVIGDLGCDVEGAIECTLKCTEPSDPVYVYQPQTDTIESGVEGNGPVVLAVDILPAELPREASEEFSDALARFLPALARADFNVPFSDLDLPPELLGAVIVHGGKLTPDFVYLDAHLARSSHRVS